MLKTRNCDGVIGLLCSKTSVVSVWLKVKEELPYCKGQWTIFTNPVAFENLLHFRHKQTKQKISHAVLHLIQPCLLTPLMDFSKLYYTEFTLFIVLHTYPELLSSTCTNVFTQITGKKISGDICY